ncbi:MAG: hypothetical protein ABIN89_23745 [Chitinophagaceae bacterium]
MKRYLNLLKISIYTTLMLSAYQSMAGDGPDVEKQKTYSKTYSISADDNISINNQFGEVKVIGWNKNEVKVDVIIIGKSETDERAQEILDRISIQDGKNSNGVYFKTNMNNDHKNREGRKKYKDEKMQINYQVYMPVSNSLLLENQFGATIIPDMSGKVEISSRFGTLTTGKLTNVKKINIEFGSGNIESISNGTLVVKFSRAIINKLDGSVDAIFEHSSGVKLGVENSAKALNVTSAFSTLYLDITKNLSATFEINTSFGGLSNKTDFDIKEDEKSKGRNPNFNHSYSGKSGSGNTAMRISSSFSQIKIGHDLTMDLKEEKKDKKKT